MDFIVGLPKSRNTKVVIMVVYHLSKYGHLCVIQHPFTTSTTTHFFMDNIFKLYGMPHFVNFDKDPTFTNDFWKQLLRPQGT